MSLKNPPGCFLWENGDLYSLWNPNLAATRKLDISWCNYYCFNFPLMIEQDDWLYHHISTWNQIPVTIEWEIADSDRSLKNLINKL